MQSLHACEVIPFNKCYQIFFKFYFIVAVQTAMHFILRYFLSINYKLCKTKRAKGPSKQRDFFFALGIFAAIKLRRTDEFRITKNK